MTVPMDPNLQEPVGASEYSWGKGLFPPGIAKNEGQLKQQDDFSKATIPAADGETLDDNYARAVADRRTDPTNPQSERDFTCYGNPDRFGPNPELVREDPQPNVATPVKREWPPLTRAK